MAKKKKHKKHQFKQSTPAAAPATETKAPSSSKTTLATEPSVSINTLVPHLPLILRDLRTVLILAGSFIVLEFVLWYLLGYTGIGPRIYQLIKV